MKETTDGLKQSYYPSAHRMVVSTKNEAVGSGLNKPRRELTVIHDQWVETSVVLNAGQQPPSQQPQQPQQQQQQQQQQSPSVRCTVCKDSDGNPIFYRPSMALHTLFQVPDQDDPSPATTRYSKRLTATHDGAVLQKVESNKKISNRLSYISAYDMADGDGIKVNTSSNDNSSRVRNDVEHSGYIDDNSNGIDEGDDDDDDDDDDNDDDDDDGGIYQRLVIPKQRQSYVTLYDATNDHPIWTLIEQDWHTMTLISRQPPQKYTMMTTSTFSFVWEDQVINGQQQPNSYFLFPYQWRMQIAQDGKTMELLCEQCQTDKTKLPIALLANQATQLILFGNEDNRTSLGTTDESNNTTATALGNDDSSKNPFRCVHDDSTSINNNSHLHRQRKLDSLDTYLILSSLLLYDLITSQLRALGGGSEAMVMMIDRQQQALKEETDLIYEQYQQQQQQQQQQQIPTSNGGALNRISHTNSSQYYSEHNSMVGQHGMTSDDTMDDMEREVMDHHHNGNNNDNNHQLRWSSNGSLKSLELDPGFWRCCFGYGCWWHWFPCCMPGGWCDRAWIKARGVRRQQYHHHHRSRVTRRMQGWQQQE